MSDTTPSMTQEEIDEFLAGRRSMSMATVNRDGSIHMVARSLLDGAPANGWDLWLYNDKNGERQTIDALRQTIRKNNVGR